MVTVLRRSRGRGAWAALLFAGFFASLPVGTVSSQEVKGPQKSGLYVLVSTALEQKDVHRIKQRIEDVQKKEKRPIEIVIFDFNPGGQANGSSDFGACDSLRDLIEKLRKGHFGEAVKTVAFVSKDVTRHAVLPVLACSELVMADDPEHRRVGSIGDILGERDLSKVERTAYEEVADRPGLPALIGSPALVFKMINANLQIHKVTYQGATRYWDVDEMAKKKAEAAQFTDLGPAGGVNNGQPRYDAELARKLTLCGAIRKDAAEVVQKYRLPRSVLTEVWLGDRPTVAGLIEVHGQLDKGKLQALERRIDRARGRNVNFLILYLDCPGGDNTDEAFRLGQRLVELKNDTGKDPVRTVAYVPSGVALGVGTYLAVGCNEIVMGKDAVLGDFGNLKTPNDDDHAGRREQLVKLAQQQGYPAALFEAMLDRSIGIVRVQSRTDANDYPIVKEKEFLADKESAAPKWLPEYQRIHGAGEFFKLAAAKAREFDVANAKEIAAVDQAGQMEELYRLYNLDGTRVNHFRDDWLDVVAEFFRKPLVKLVLIMLGIIGMILELKMPGATLPGIVAAVCFVLFFWAHSFIGEYTMLAVLLFVLGLIMIGLEVFVFPGFGVPGIAGILLVVGSLVLVTLEKMPSTTQDWMDLGVTLTTFGVGLAGAIAGAFTLAWYLPHIPYANRLVLQPPALETETAEGSANPLAGLLGAIGVAETSLRPAGKARFGEDFYDVMAEGDFVSPGGRVQVIEIEGQRIVVKEV